MDAGPVFATLIAQNNGDHLPPGGCNEFFADWKRFNTPVREISTPVWKRILRRAGIPI